jgi:phosphate starvation-inducible protein PhoH
MRKKHNVVSMEESVPSIVPKSYQSSKQKIKLEHLKTISPLTDNQRFVFQEWVQDQHLVLHGVAGTGKTFLAIYLALKEVLTKGTNQHKVIIVKSAVQTRDIGFTKGTREEKEFEYVVPYISICKELFPTIENPYQQLVEQGIIEFMSTSFMRGVTFNNSIIVCDEMQQGTFQELDMVATRVGEDSRIIFSGDFVQTDLKKGEKTGFHDLLKIVKEMPCFTNIEFTVDDVVRSGFVKEFILTKLKLGL